MELAEMIDDLLKQSSEAHELHREACQRNDLARAEQQLYKYVTLLHAARMVDAAMKRERYVETRQWRA